MQCVRFIYKLEDSKQMEIKPVQNRGKINFMYLKCLILEATF